MELLIRRRENPDDDDFVNDGRTLVLPDEVDESIETFAERAVDDDKGLLDITSDVALAAGPSSSMSSATPSSPSDAVGRPSASSNRKSS